MPIEDPKDLYPFKKLFNKIKSNSFITHKFGGDVNDLEENLNEILMKLKYLRCPLSRRKIKDIPIDELSFSISKGAIQLFDSNYLHKKYSSNIDSENGLWLVSSFAICNFKGFQEKQNCKVYKSYKDQFDTHLPEEDLGLIEFNKHDLSYSNLRCTNLEKSKFKYSKCCGVDFTGANLKGIEVINCDFTGAIFDNNNIKRIIDTLYRNHSSTAIETKHIYVISPNNLLPCMPNIKNKMTLEDAFCRYGEQEQLASTEDKEGCLGVFRDLILNCSLRNR